MKCPGQDPRYWTEDVVSDVPCPNCGRAVEFFRDETSARCPDCGSRFRNPNLDLACAEWCAYAEQCLGYAPEKQVPAASGQGGLTGRLLQAVKEVFRDRPARLAHALLVFQHAKELVGKEGGDPRVVLAAALLLDVEAGEDAQGPGEAPKVEAQAESAATEILQGIQLDEEVIRRAAGIVDAFRRREAVDTLEFTIVSDADLLARLAERRDRFDRLPAELESRLKTSSAKKRAAELFDKGPGKAEG